MSNNNDPTQRPKTPIRTVKVHAHGEDFRIVQLQGNLFVCSKANGSCCCGWTDKGRAPVNTALYEVEWERRTIRNQGPCAVGNNALLQLFGQSIWFKNLNDDQYIPAMFDYIEAMLHTGNVVPPSPELAEHVYTRYLPPPISDVIPLGTTPTDEEDGLERLDPVCLMDVDPQTARWTSQYNGRTYAFCAPACKKAFDRDPQAYAIA